MCFMTIFPSCNRPPASTLEVSPRIFYLPRSTCRLWAILMFASGFLHNPKNFLQSPPMITSVTVTISKALIRTACVH